MRRTGWVGVLVGVQIEVRQGKGETTNPDDSEDRLSETEPGLKGHHVRGPGRGVEARAGGGGGGGRREPAPAKDDEVKHGQQTQGRRQPPPYRGGDGEEAAGEEERMPPPREAEGHGHARLQQRRLHPAELGGVAVGAGGGGGAAVGEVEGAAAAAEAARVVAVAIVPVVAGGVLARLSGGGRGRVAAVEEVGGGGAISRTPLCGCLDFVGHQEVVLSPWSMEWRPWVLVEGWG